MAEPQNLRFRQFQAFFGLEGKKSNKNKKLVQFFLLFLIIFQAKKIENQTTVNHQVGRILDALQENIMLRYFINFSSITLMDL